MGKFTVKHRPELLLAVLREVLVHASPDAPASVTQRAYNEARASAGHPDAPRADKLTRRFGVPWPRLCAEAVARDDAAYTLAVASKGRVRPVLTEAEIVAALRTAAARLGTDQITSTDYETARTQINADIARRHRHGAHIKPLPSADTLLKNATSWGTALAAAGLVQSDGARRRPMPKPEAVGLFVEHCGFLPAIMELRWFGRHHRIALASHQNEPHQAAVDQARQRAAKEARWFPAGRPRPLPPDWKDLASESSPATLDAAARYPAVNRAGYSFEQVQAGISRAFDLCDAGERLTTRRYRVLSQTHGLPPLSVIDRAAREHKTNFSELVHAEVTRRIEAIHSS